MIQTQQDCNFSSPHLGCWLDKYYNFMSDDEWAIFLLSIIIGWIVSEYIKRNIVWKTKASKNKKLSITIPINKNASLKLSIMHLISFFITFVVAYLLWPDNGEVNNPIIMGIAAGIFSPIVHKILITILVKLNFVKFAVFVSGDRRLPKSKKHKKGDSDGR